MDSTINNKLDVVDAPTVTEIRKNIKDIIFWIRLGIVVLVIIVFFIGAIQSVFRGGTINVAPLEAAVKNVDIETWQILSILKEMQTNNSINSTTTLKTPGLMEA